MKTGEFWVETKTGRVGIVSEIIPPRPVVSNIVSVTFADELTKMMNGKSFVRNFRIATPEEAMFFPHGVASEVPRRFPRS